MNRNDRGEFRPEGLDEVFLCLLSGLRGKGALKPILARDAVRGEDRTEFLLNEVVDPIGKREKIKVGIETKNHIIIITSGSHISTEEVLNHSPNFGMERRRTDFTDRLFDDLALG